MDGALIHFTGNTINLSPLLIVERSQIDQTCHAIGESMDEIARFGRGSQRSERTNPSKELGKCG